MVTNDAARRIAEYEQLRAKLSQLYAEAADVDRRLTELERLLPDDYIFPGDLSKDWRPP